MESNQEIFNLDNAEFDRFKYQFNSILRALIERMDHKNISSGKINVCFDIEIHDGSVDTGKRNENDEPIFRPIMIPVVQHKITSCFQVKQNATATYLGRDFALVWDEEQGNYLLKKVQPGLFDGIDGQQ